MARRSKGFIELEWTCPNCNARNRGSEKTCVSCGAPQPEDVQFEAPAERKLVSDETARELRKRGADVHCGFCETRNPSTAATCSQCGADLKAGKARQAGQEIATPADEPEEVTGGSNWKWFAGIGAALVICCAAIYFLYFLLFVPTSSVQGTVTDVHWQTSVPVQELQAVYYRDKLGSPPSDAYDVSCRTRIESEEVCEERTVDRGDGFAEVIDDCHTETETVQYCNYTVNEWETIHTYTLEGHDYLPTYEQPTLTSNQRPGNKRVDYTVYFETEKGQKSHSPYDLAEFQQFQIDSTWTLNLNTLGDVVSAER